MFYNKNISVGNSYVYIGSWFKRNICYVNDLLDADGNFLTLDEFNILYNLNTNFLTFQGIISAIKKFIKTNFGRDNTIPKIESPFIRNAIYHVINSKKGSKVFYIVFNSTKHITLSKGMTKWKDLFDLSHDECTKLFSVAFNATINTKLQWFQVRILNRILCTNSFLYKIDKADTSLCTFCQRDDETIDHLFWECEEVQTFLSLLDEYCFDTLHYSLQLSKKEFILGFATDKSCKNTIILQIKYYIYSMRCLKRNLSVHGAISYIKKGLEICKHIAYRNNKVEKYTNYWNNWLNIL